MNIQLRNCLTIVTLFIGMLAFGQSHTDINSKISSFLNNLSKDDFSGTILVAHNDTIIEKRVYGLASIEYNIKNNHFVYYT